MGAATMGSNRLALDYFTLAGALVTLASVTTFVLLPIGTVISKSLTDLAGRLDWSGLWNIISSDTVRVPFRNSLLLALVSALTATSLGFCFAYALVRTEVPGRKMFEWLALVPMISPPFALSISAILLFGRRGLITYKLLGLGGFDLYGFHSLLAVQTLAYFPLAYLTIRAVLTSLDRSIEEAAESLGASGMRRFFTITLPLCAPGVLSAFLFTMVASLEDFGNPLVLGGDFVTLAASAYVEIVGMSRLREGSILALILLIPTLTFFHVARHWLGSRSFVTVTGKPGAGIQRTRNPIVTVPLLTIMSSTALVVVVLYGMIIYGSFASVWGVNWTPSLTHWRDIALRWRTPVQASLLIAVVTAILASGLGALMAYVFTRRRIPAGSILESASLLAYGVPGIVVGIGYVLAFNTPPLVLTGTPYILILALMFRNLPVAIQTAIASLRQVDKAIEEAAIGLGASTGRMFSGITLPLMRESLLAALIWNYVRAMTAVSTVVLLISPRWQQIGRAHV